MSFDEWGLIVATVVVVFGVFLEGAEHLDDIKKKGWRPLAPKIGFAILVVGLAAETVFETRIGQAESKFRIAAMHEMGSLNDEAAKLRNQAAGTQKEAEELQADAALLVASLQPRHIPQIYIDHKRQIDSRQFEASMKCCFPGIRVVVRSVLEKEPQALACEIVAFAKKIGWSANLELPTVEVCSEGSLNDGLTILSPWKYPVEDRERLGMGVLKPLTTSDVTYLAAHRLSEYWRRTGLDNLHEGFDMNPQQLGALTPEPNLILIVVGSKRPDTTILDRVTMEAWRKTMPSK